MFGNNTLLVLVLSIMPLYGGSNPPDTFKAINFDNQSIDLLNKIVNVGVNIEEKTEIVKQQNIIIDSLKAIAVLEDKNPTITSKKKKPFYWNKPKERKIERLALYYFSIPKPSGQILLIKPFYERETNYDKVRKKIRLWLRPIDKQTP